MNKGKGPPRDDVVVVTMFCERMLKLLQLVKQISDNPRMLTSKFAVALATGQAVELKPIPKSLLHLMHQIEDVAAATSEGDMITVTAANQNLTRYAREFISSAWDGSLCKKKFGRKVPLAFAIHSLAPVLEKASMAIMEVGGLLDAGQNFRKGCRKTFKVSKT